GIAGTQSTDLAASARTVDGIRVLATRVDDLDEKALRELADRLKEKLAPSVVMLGTTDGEKVTLVSTVSKDLLKRYHAGNLIKRVAPRAGGGAAAGRTSRRRAARTRAASTRRWRTSTP